MTNSYTVDPCSLCHQFVSNNGLAQTAHIMMHVREGYFTLVKQYPNEYLRTSKPFDVDAYRKDHPNKAYTRDDYWPSDVPKKYR